MRNLFAILAAAIWINGNEFLRNEILLKGVWQAHFESLGQRFPDAPVNGMIWIVWGIVFAGLVFALTRKFDLIPGGALAWIAAFPMMWLVLFNLMVLPFGILWLAVPLSLLEAFGAAYLCRRIAPPGH